MRLTDLIKLENIKVPLAATTKLAAIEELVELLAANGQITDSRKVLEAVLEREATRTTGIGQGHAIPHGKSSGTKQLVLVVGKLAKPIDFQAIDGKPVGMIWLLSSPPDQTGPHIHALARISRLLTMERFRAGLVSAATAQDIFDTILKQEAEM